MLEELPRLLVLYVNETGKIFMYLFLRCRSAAESNQRPRFEKPNIPEARTGVILRPCFHNNIGLDPFLYVDLESIV